MRRLVPAVGPERLRGLLLHRWQPSTPKRATCTICPAEPPTESSSSPQNGSPDPHPPSGSPGPVPPSSKSQPQPQHSSLQDPDSDEGIRFVYEPPRRFVLAALRHRRQGPPVLARPRVDVLVEGSPLAAGGTRPEPAGAASRRRRGGGGSGARPKVDLPALAAALREDAAEAVKAVLARKAEARPGWKMPRIACLSLVLCDDSHISLLNSQHRGKAGPTDVLSFELDDDLDYKVHLPVKLLGDLVISLDTAARQAAERGHSLHDECRVLLVHGLLHLAGWDHERGEVEHEEMAGEERRLLGGLGWRGVGLITAAEEAADREEADGKGEKESEGEGQEQARGAGKEEEGGRKKGVLTPGEGAGFLWQMAAGGEEGQEGAKGKENGRDAGEGRSGGGGGRSVGGDRQQGRRQGGESGEGAGRGGQGPAARSGGAGRGGGGQAPASPTGPSGPAGRGGRGGRPRALPTDRVPTDTVGGWAGGRPLPGAAVSGPAAACMRPGPRGGCLVGPVPRSPLHCRPLSHSAGVAGIASVAAAPTSQPGFGAGSSRRLGGCRATVGGEAGAAGGGEAGSTAGAAGAVMAVEVKAAAAPAVGGASSAAPRRRRSKEIAIVALDLDGTLLDSRSRIRPSSVAAIRAATAAGVTVVAATGKARPAALAAAAAAGLAEPGLLVWPNGPGVFLQGLAVHGRNGTLLSDAALPEAVVREAFSYSAATGTPLVAFTGDACATTRLTPELEELHMRYYEPLAQEYADTDALLASCGGGGGGGGVRKLLFMAPPAEVAGRVLPHWRGALRGAAAEVMQAVPNMLEIVPAGVNKWGGLTTLLAHLGLPPAALMAVGDGGNDLEMVARAGVGVAMGNAVPAVAAAAAAVVGGHDEDGVAEAFERFVL